MTAPSANLQAALDAGDRTGWVFDAELPGGTKLWGQLAAGAVGAYEPRVLSWGNLPEELSDPKSGGMFQPAFTITISDEDKYFSNLTESAFADSIKLSAGILRLAAEGVAEADWSERFRGRLTAWAIADARVTLTYRQKSLPLLRPVPDTGWKIGPGNFPNAEEEVTGKIAPVIYGENDSAPYTNTGGIPVLRIDTTGFQRDLVSAGWVAVPRVFANGLVQTVTTDYTIEHPIISGRLYTLIEWTEAGAPDPDDEPVITCDVDGYDTNADGTGTVITEPAAQLEHFLINFVFGQYKRGAWDTSSDQVDATSFAATGVFFTARGYASGRRLGEPTEGATMVSEWVRSHEARAWWGFPGAGASGKVHVGVQDPNITDIYTQTWQPGYIIDGLPLAITGSDRLMVDGLSVSTAYNEVLGKPLQNFAVTQLGRTNPVEESYEQRWGPTA